jgi:hypothetical protein
MHKTVEIWKWARSHKNYYKLFSTGRVELVRDINYTYLNRGKYKVQKKVKKGVVRIKYYGSYPKVVLYFPNGKKECPRLHRLMLETFIGPCPEGMESRHLDDCRVNNSIENLDWGTSKQNTQDAKKKWKTVCWRKMPLE